MKKLTKAGIALGAVAAVVATGAMVVSAWGPTGRKTFTMKNPADYITFNSITDNVIGDERYFVSGSKWTGNNKDNYFSDNTVVEDGKEYVVRIYVHNNAGANLKLVAENVKAYVNLPTETNTKITVSGKISSTNANPTSVWDETHFVSKNGEKFNLAYVDGSAIYSNSDANGKIRNFKLGKELLDSRGALLGYDKMDGKIPGCNMYSGYLTFKVKAQYEQKPNVEIQKEVKLLGSELWSEQVKAKSGDTVRYRIQVKNTGNTTLTGLIVRDVLPANLEYIKGTTTIVNANHKTPVTLSDNIVSATGINIGDYAAGANAVLYFNAKVKDGVSDKCSDTILRNIAQTSAGKSTGTKEDTADVLVEGKTCDENFTLNKMVQLKGGNTWAENVTAKAGDTIRYRIQFKSTGDGVLKNVVIRDVLPAGISYVKGSTVLYNAGSSIGKKLDDGIITEAGVNIGDYEKNAEATIYFFATVNTPADECQTSVIRNIAKGKYNNDDKTEKSDEADVTIDAVSCGDTPVIPKTGATTVISSVFGAASIATAAGYYIISRKKLN